MTQSNMYSASAADVWEIFCDHVEGNPAAVVLALSWNPLGDASRNALAKSFESLGYGKEVCAFATILIAITYGSVLLMNLVIKFFGTSRKMKEAE